MRAALIAAALVAACTAAPAPVSQRPMPARDLTGQTWVLDRLAGEPVTVPVTASFDAAQVSGVAPCNNFVGNYRRDGDRLSIGPVAATRRACPALDLENRFLTALGNTASVAFTAAQMELRGADGQPLMVFVAAN